MANNILQAMEIFALMGQDAREFTKFDTEVGNQPRLRTAA